LSPDSPEQDQLQAQLQELEKQKAEIQERLTAAEAATAAQPKAEPVAGHSTEELTQQHQVELTALETRLKTEHEQALQAAVEAARAAAPPADAPAGTYNEEDIAAAVERGRKELGAKLKIKDSQIANLQAKLKKVEQQMLDLTAIEGGDAALAKPTAASTSAAGAAGAAAGAKPIARKLSMPVAANGAPAPGAVAAATRASAAGTAPAPAALARGRGRGRGAAPAARGGGVGRGAAPATAAGSAPATAPSLTIAGAAAKRAREEGGETAADTLAKRLKPTDGLSKPVGIRRPPPPAS
jgi:nucleoprotein TPR